MRSINTRTPSAGGQAARKENNMFTLLFETKAEKTVESVNEAFQRETGISDWGYESMDDILKAEKEGFLEFSGNVMKVYADM